MHATQQQGGSCPEPTRRMDGLPETDADRRFFDLRDSGYTGWIDQDGYPAGYFVTDWGLTALADAEAPVSLGELPHAATPCHNGGEPHLGPCVEPRADEAPGTAGQVLRSAALYLERHGWIQGTYYDTTSTGFAPAACMVGAIGMACYGGPVDAPAQHFDDPGFLDFEEAVLHLDRYLMVEDGSESYEFNDAKGRTAEDVIAALRQAAARPAEELIDAIRAIEATNTDMAAILALLTPSGLWGDTAASATSGGGDPE